MIDIKQYLLSTKALMYYAVFFAFVVGLLTTKWVGVISGLVLFVFELGYLVMSRHFACLKCNAGVIGAALVLLLLLGFLPTTLYSVVVVVIAVDVFLHAV